MDRLLALIGLHRDTECLHQQNWVERRWRTTQRTVKVYFNCRSCGYEKTGEILGADENTVVGHRICRKGVVLDA